MVKSLKNIHLKNIVIKLFFIPKLLSNVSGEETITIDDIIQSENINKVDYIKNGYRGDMNLLALKWRNNVSGYEC